MLIHIKISIPTVEPRNTGSVEIDKTWYIMENMPYSLVQDFLHQQYQDFPDFFIGMR